MASASKISASIMSASVSRNSATSGRRCWRRAAEQNWIHFMLLPIKPPYPPMEALAVEKIPTGESWRYEPKWDGFRCLVFKDGEKVELQSKKGEPLGRYFPELVAAAR